MIEQRHLDESEEFFLKDNGNDIFLTTKYSGKVDAKALELAYNHLCQRHPMLSSRIRQDRGRYLLHFSTDNESEFETKDANFDDILDRFGEPPRFCLTERGFEKNLARTILVQNDEGGYVILGVHHALYAGAGAWELPRNLWEIYTRIIEGDNPNETIGKLPPSPSEVLRDRGFDLNHTNGDESKKLAELKSEWKSSTLQYIQLSERETAEILNAAKSNNVSVGGFMLGSLVRALRQSDRDVEHDTLDVGTLMDMGRYVDPPISALDTTYFATPLTTHVSTFGSAIDIGHEFESNLKREMTKRSNFRPLSAESSGLIAPGPTRPTVGLNNGGKIRTYATPKGVEIDNICLPHIMTATAPMLHEEPTAPGRRATVASLTYDSKMTLILSAATEIFEKFMRSLSIQMLDYNVTINELSEYEV